MATQDLLLLKSNENLSKSAICVYLDRIHREITMEKGIYDRQSLKNFLNDTIIDNSNYLESVKDVECSNFHSYKVYIFTARALHEFLFEEYKDGINAENVAEMILKYYWTIVNGIYNDGEVPDKVVLKLEY